MLLKQNKTNLKYLLIVVILIAIVGGGILWFAAKQEALLTEFPEIKIPEDETADWKTYRNEEHGFEIKYPTFFSDVTEINKGWWIGLPDLRNFNFFYCYDCEKMEEQIFTNICSYSITVTPFDNSSNLSFEDWFNKYSKHFGYSNQVKEEIIIGGIKGVRLGKLSGLPPGGGTIDGLLLIPRNSKVYGISLNIDDELLGTDENYATQCYSKAENTFEQILSTFQFIGKPAVEEPVIEEPVIEEPPVEHQKSETEQLIFDFCSHYKEYGEEYITDDRYWKPSLVSLVDFNGKGKNEILGVCGYGGYGGHHVLFVLDAQGKELLKVEELEQPMRFFTFHDVKAIDVNNDGRDEIIYKTAGWTIDFSSNSVHLYSSSLDAWMWASGVIKYIPTKDEFGQEYSFSENLGSAGNKVFKEFLLQEIQGWDDAPLRHYLTE